MTTLSPSFGWPVFESSVASRTPPARRRPAGSSAGSGVKVTARSASAARSGTTPAATARGTEMGSSQRASTTDVALKASDLKSTAKRPTCS